MTDRFADLRRVVEDSVLRGPGVTSPSLRQAAAECGEVPDDLREVLEKERRHAFKVTDEDIASLRHGYSQDEIFEVVAATALGEAKRRLEKVLGLLETPS